eukprot:7693318-Pyramimonas_sp.AAC.1
MPTAGTHRTRGERRDGTSRRPATRRATRVPCVRLVRCKNIPACPASDWSAVRIYPRVLRPIYPL